MGGFSGRRAPFFVSDFIFAFVVVVVVEADALPFDALDPAALPPEPPLPATAAAPVFLVTVVVITSVVDSMVDDDRSASVICDGTGTDAPLNAILLNFCCSPVLPP